MAQALSPSAPTVFLSYSTDDHFFADLVEIKLAEAGIKLWRDQGQLRAGSDWREVIEKGISDSIAVLIALSVNSAASPYVTFEWAYALGKGKTIIPVKLTDCTVHPRLQMVQYLDFRKPGALPWIALIDHIQKVEEIDPADSPPQNTGAPSDNPVVKEILAYLDKRGYNMASFERLRNSVDYNLTDPDFDKLIADYPTTFRGARIKGGKPGLAKVIP